METQTTNARPRADAGKRPVLLFRDSPEGKPSLRQVFEAEESPLIRFAYGLVGQRETAEDLVQDAFLKLHAHWDEVENPRAWLFRCIRNLALNHLRDHQRETPILESEDFPAPTTDPDQSLGQLKTIGTLQLLINPHFPALRPDPMALSGAPATDPSHSQKTGG